MFNKTITDFGAVGDGVTLNTLNIQKAIDACAAEGGGRVTVSDGAYVTGTLFLHSGVELHLSVTGKLLASLDGSDYPNFQPATWDAYKAPRHSSRCLIYAENAENVAITGRGTIDCRGEHFCADEHNGDRFWRRQTTELPARMLFFYGCKNVLLENFSLVEMAGGWAAWINNCDFVNCSALKIRCNQHYPNSDGIHINCSSDVTVSNCSIICGDDAVIVRANTNTLERKRACERVSVVGCHLSSLSNAIRIGWTNDGKIQNCVFSNCTVTDSWRGISIEFPKKSPEPFADQGEDFTEVKNLIFDNIVMDRIDELPLQILVYPYNQVREIRDVRFSNIIAECGIFPVFKGMDGVNIKDIELTHCKFKKTKTLPGTADGCEMSFIGGIKMEDVQFSSVD